MNPEKDRAAPFRNLQAQVDELFEELVFRRWGRARSSSWRPAIDLYETENAYLIEVDLPSVPPENVQFRVHPRGLVIRGNRSPATPLQTLLHRCERAVGPFERTVELARDIVPQNCRAEFYLGTYRIHLPKKQPGTVVGEPVVDVVGSFFVIQVDAD